MGTVDTDFENNALIINGTTVYMINTDGPKAIDYTQYGAQDALIIDNTGAFRTKTELARHLKSGGAIQVLLTAPGKKIPNIVQGVNHKMYDSDTLKICAAASCTTDTIMPILKIIEDSFGIKK